MEKTSDLWSLGKVDSEGSVTLVRYRALPAFEVRTGWPKQLLIEWHRQPGLDGLPGSAEHAEAKRFEDHITRALEGGDDGFLALVTTGNGCREWYFYCRAPLLLQGRLNRALRNHSAVAIQLHSGDDPEWNVYFEFVRSLVHETP